MRSQVQVQNLQLLQASALSFDDVHVDVCGSRFPYASESVRGQFYQYSHGEDVHAEFQLNLQIFPPEHKCQYT